MVETKIRGKMPFHILVTRSRKVLTNPIHFLNKKCKNSQKIVGIQGSPLSPTVRGLDLLFEPPLPFQALLAADRWPEPAQHGPPDVLLPSQSNPLPPSDVYQVPLPPLPQEPALRIKSHSEGIHDLQPRVLCVPDPEASFCPLMVCPHSSAPASFAAGPVTS